MAFPVDILDDCSHEDLESSAEDYLSDLRCGDPRNPEFISLPGKGNIPVRLSMVGFVPLYGGDQTHKMLALFEPEDTLTAVAFYLADQWWAIEDIVRTSSPQREGILKVESLGERVVLYVLNRIIYRKLEMTKNEMPFLCHRSTDFAKIMWKKGEAVGFYSVKLAGSICSSYLTQRYHLPVLDTMFVRRRHREKDFGLQMLEDFVDSFSEDALGLRYPISMTLFTVCKQYLEKYPGDQELLWEIEGVGHWFQRTRIANRIQKEAHKTIEASPCEHSMSTTGETSLKATTEPEIGSKHSTETQHKTSTVQCMVDSNEDENAMEIQANIAEDYDITPVSTRTRSSQLKRPKIGRRIQEPEMEEDDGVIQTSLVRTVSVLHTSTNIEEYLENKAEESSDANPVHVLQEPAIPASPEESEETCKPPPCKLEDEGIAEHETLTSEITEERLAIGKETFSDGEVSVEPEDPNEEVRTVLFPVTVGSMETSLDIPTEQKTKQAIINGEITETVGIGSATGNTLSGGEFVAPENPERELFTVLVPVTVESLETSMDIPADQRTEPKSLSSVVADQMLAVKENKCTMVCDGEPSLETDNPEEDPCTDTDIGPAIVQPFNYSRDTSAEQKTAPESQNSDFTEELLEAVPRTSNALSDGESVETGNPEKENVVVPIPVTIATSSITLDAPPDQAANPASMEISNDDNCSTDTNGNVAKEEQILEDKRVPESTDEAAAPPLARDPADNGLPYSVHSEALKESIASEASPDVVPLLQDTHQVAMHDAIGVYEGLKQGSVVVELKDVSSQHHTDGHKSQSEEQSEESAVEKVVESSSEEAEAPVRERRGLRRKAVGLRGRPRKRGRLAVKHSSN
ncbi:soluble lamin-associated protein of 75 kDa isoform X1 [Ambystoma mexicanum]|uniref:soluble lamin-associated protein of 75 kDa isoform X1 n=1 Tax=Ambystoma mexicanum TaxID=8296 RepID=UPI0037E71F47